MGANIWDIILKQNWLLGAILSIVSGVVACLGLTLQKTAQYRHIGDEVTNLNGQVSVLQKPGWPTLLKSPLWLAGVGLLLLHSPINMLAIDFSPESTCMPLSASMVLFNFVFAYGFSGETFSKNDIRYTVLCVVSAIVMNLSLPKNRLGHVEDFPVEQLLGVYQNLFSNVGFVGYCCAWCALVAFSIVVLKASSVWADGMRSFALPMLVGLFQSQFHFVAKVAATLLKRSLDEPAVWTEMRLYYLMIGTASLYILSMYLTIQGCRSLALRYFVPSIFVSVTCLTVLQSLLFFRDWQVMAYKDIWIWAVSEIVCFVAVFNISPIISVIAPPPDSPGSPRMKDASNVIKQHKAILSIMDEYDTRKHLPQDPKPLSVFKMEGYTHGWYRFLPITITVAIATVPLGLFFADYAFTAFVLLTIYQVYNSWKMGMHIALFSFVGIKKIMHYAEADFQKLYEAESKQRRSSKFSNSAQQLEPMPTDVDKLGFLDVKHFVLLPNFEEEEECLAMAIGSVAQSPIARSNIVLVLAMEEREQDVKAKAQRLCSRFESRFLKIFPTYHPPGLEGETPGKSANTRWAADQLFKDSIKEGSAEAFNYSNSLLTVADADSEFHSGYFAALTYHFLHAGGPEGETPSRFMTIWQPPILHFKNYLRQTSIVRLASIVQTQHELANLADPNATRVPYSTYSISARLAKEVGGWDPDWISEDWHMAIKCFMALQGELKVLPIFLPICNYATEGKTAVEAVWARFVQAKRHALGFSELLYLHHFYPKVKQSISNPAKRSEFSSKAFFLWLKLLTIHVVMATLLIIGPFNGYLIYYFASNRITVALNVNSWTFLINCVFQAVMIISIVCTFAVSVFLFENVKDRIDDAMVLGPGSKEMVDNPQLTIFWRNKWMHLLSTIPDALLALPVFFLFASSAEWIAAVKTATTHKFKYDVAAKKI